MNKLFFLKISQFGIVGLSGVVIDLGATWILKEQLYIQPYISSCTGFTLAVLNNYILNKYWTFEEKGKLSIKQFLGFILVSIGGLILNTLSVKLLYEIVRFNFYISKLLAVLIVVPWNFIANSIFVFKKQKNTI